MKHLFHIFSPIQRVLLGGFGNWLRFAAVFDSLALSVEDRPGIDSSLRLTFYVIPLMPTKAFGHEIQARMESVTFDIFT